MRFLPLLTSVIVMSLCSCLEKPGTPALVAERCFGHLAKGDFKAASKDFPRQEADLQWVESYYGEQALDKIFKVTINDTVTFGDQAIVTYTPEKVLLYDFGGKNFALLERKDGHWKMNLMDSLHLMKSFGPSGAKGDLTALKYLVDKATAELGKTPANIRQVINAEEEPSLRERKAGWAKGYDYHPEGAEKGGEKDVIFYSVEPSSPGIYVGLSKTCYFLSDGSRAFLKVDHPAAKP